MSTWNKRTLILSLGSEGNDDMDWGYSNDLMSRMQWKNLRSNQNFLAQKFNSCTKQLNEYDSNIQPIAYIEI